MALKRESDRIRERIYQAQAGHGPPRGPPGFLTGLASAHKVYFCIADKTDEVSDLRLSRLDSLGELTGQTLRRARSKSEAVQDISSGNIDEFAQLLLEKGFKVFDEEER